MFSLDGSQAHIPTFVKVKASNVESTIVSFHSNLPKILFGVELGEAALKIEMSTPYDCTRILHVSASCP